MRKILPICSFVLLIFGFISKTFQDNEFSSLESGESKVRTIKYDKGINIDKNEFKSTNYKDCIDGFVFTAIKNFSQSLFSNIDFVSESKGEEIDVTYEVNYYESEGRVSLNVYEVRDSIKSNLVDIVEGLITLNEDGEIDVIFADENETIFLSQLIKETVIDNVGWWDCLCNWISGIASKVRKVIVSGLRLLTHVVVEIIGLDGGAKFLNISKDSNGIYHADFDCRQQYAGYNDFYDFVFNLGTKMSCFKNDFYDKDCDGKNDYILWGWEGDYWELGYGAELGIYKRFKNSELWYVDKKLAIDMTLKVDYRKSIYESWENIIDRNPANASGYSSKQWWITGFNPKYANMKISNTNLIRATYTVKFETKGYSSSFDKALKDNFKTKYVDLIKQWTFDQSSSLFTYSFI